ncbi:MAG TPA: hypothetical protein VG298_15890 [Acidimicrobiales bacterium]|jgi:hypothetical protein|nr:hypothetical protein [Acidimicrobiales bacterium]
MAKEKATITIDRAKAALALKVSGARSTSEVVDLALDQLIRAERLRSDIAAYQGAPPTAAELELALLGDSSNLADDTDWEQLYAEDNEA